MRTSGCCGCVHSWRGLTATPQLPRSAGIAIATWRERLPSRGTSSGQRQLHDRGLFLTGSVKPPGFFLVRRLILADAGGLVACVRPDLLTIRGSRWSRGLGPAYGQCVDPGDRLGRDLGGVGRASWFGAWVVVLMAVVGGGESGCAAWRMMAVGSRRGFGGRDLSDLAAMMGLCLRSHRLPRQ